MSGTNPVGAWALPFSTGGSVDDPTSYKGKIDANFAVAQRVADAFAPKPASPAAMSIIVDAGFTVGTGPERRCNPSSTSARRRLRCSRAGRAQQSYRPRGARRSERHGERRHRYAGRLAGRAGARRRQEADRTGLGAEWHDQHRQRQHHRFARGWQTNVPGVRWAIAGGSADTITASYTPANATLADGLILGFRATRRECDDDAELQRRRAWRQDDVKQGGAPLAPGDIPGALAECMIRYNAANARWELLNPAASSFTTGDVKTTLKTAADAGWVMMNDGTIGDASSGATTRANADTQALFTLLWTNVSNTNCPVSGGRGASAAADFAAHKTIALPKMLGERWLRPGAGGRPHRAKSR